MENSFKSIIERSKSILILLPTKPHLDQVAAGLSLYLALKDKRDVTISSPTPMTVEFNRLVGVNRIATEVGNKNLIIRFSDYKANDIERVSYDIEDGQFRLTVIPKQRILPPSKDQIELAYSGVSADTVIIIGGSDESSFPAISQKELSGSNLVHIGVKQLSLSANKSYISFSRPASSVSEVVFGLIYESGLLIDPDIATNLLMGLEVATDSFVTGNVTSDTFAITSELIRAGGKRVAFEQLQQMTYPPGSIPGQVPQQAQNLQQVPTSQPTQQMQVPLPNQPMMVQPQVAPQSQVPQPDQPQPIQNENQTQDYLEVQQKIQDQKNLEKDETNENPPKDWLEPKIFKGTSAS